MSLRDRIAYRRGRVMATVRDWSEVLMLAITTVAVAIAVVTLIQARGTSAGAARAANRAAASADRAADAQRAQKVSDDRAVERDAARTFQRCEQIEPVATVVQLAVDSSPNLRELIRRDHPDVLDPGGHLPVPDCRRIYPLGAAVSGRYPDLTPTKPAP